MSILAPKFVITNAGLAAASIATPSGPYVNISEWRLGAAFGYSPAPTDTGLHGSLLFTGTPYSYTQLDDNTLDIILLDDVNSGPFAYGEVGLYLPGGVLFALACFDSPQQKLKSLGVQIGSRLKIHSLIKLAQGANVIQVNITQATALLELPQWSSLSTPVSQLSGANAIIIHENDPNGDAPMVIRKSDNEWTPVGYSYKGTGTIDSATTTSITSSYFLNTTLDGATSRRYILKFMTSGLIRAVSSIVTNSANLATSITVQAGTFEIYEATSMISDAVPLASETEYNLLANAYNPTWSTPNGFVTPQTNRGWKQNLVPTPLSRAPSTADWAYLINSVINGAKLTGTDFSSVVLTDFLISRTDAARKGIIAVKKIYDDLVTCMNSVIANHNSSDPAFLETSQPAGGTATKSGTTWVNIASVTHVLTLDYADAATMQATFNGGGYVSLFGSVATPQNGQEFAWQTFLIANGTIKMFYHTTIATSGLGTGSTLGLYDLTGSYQTLWTRTIAAPVGNITYTLEGKKTSSTQLQFRITFADSSTPGPYSGATTAVLSSIAVLGRPSSTVINNPTITYPTASSTGIS